MSAQHTPGRLWHDTTGYPRSDVREVGTNRNVANTWGTGGQPKSREAYERRQEEDRANARRLVACWNACQGVPTEVLEANSAGGLTWRVADQIEERIRRDDLLVALQRLAAYCDRMRMPGYPLSDAEKAAQAAIAKATGSAA